GELARIRKQPSNARGPPSQLKWIGLTCPNRFDFGCLAFNVLIHNLSRTKHMNTEVKPPYSPGLAGVIAGETEICWVDPNAGLMYRGYDIHEMAKKASFEEVAYLLLNG